MYWRRWYYAWVTWRTKFLQKWARRITGNYFFIVIFLLPSDYYVILAVCSRLSSLETNDREPKTDECSGRHVDVIFIISEVWNNSRFVPTKKHVYGHQDNTSRPITILELLNYRMDILAKKWYRSGGKFKNHFCSGHYIRSRYY